jgi:hypothetical protein
MPTTPICAKAWRTSASLCGLITAITIFTAFTSLLMSNSQRHNFTLHASRLKNETAPRQTAVTAVKSVGTPLSRFFGQRRL